MILADSSAWIEYVRATHGPADRAIGHLVGGDELATTDIVLMEVLAGAREDPHRHQLRRMLAGCEYLAVEGPTDYERAADLYRTCRAAGLTIRRLSDCLIAVVAIRRKVAVLHADRDFDAIARCSPLEIAHAGAPRL